jgi:hypothetical protein
VVFLTDVSGQPIEPFMAWYVEDGTDNVVNTSRNDPEERRSHVLRGESPISLVKFRYLLLKLALYFLQLMIAI